MTGPSDDAGGLLQHGQPELRSVRDLYDRWARVYDWNPVLDLVRPARRRAVDAMALTPGDTVVDMGTGTGANLPILSDAVGPEGTVIGIDASPGMLARASRRVAARDNVTLVEGDIRDPPLAGPVDGILSGFVVVMYAEADTLVATWADHIESGVVANLYAGPSTRRYGPAVNRLLGLYLWLFEEGWSTSSEGPRPLDVLATRGRRARETLAELATSVEHEDLVFGLAQLDTGRFEH